MRGGHALHVDDDALATKLVRSVLTRAGYRVDSASNGGEALRLLFETPPDIVLLDVEIGEENGYDLCNLLREAGTTAAVAFLTSNRTLEHVRLAREAGADYLIVKPFTPGSLLAGIEKAMLAAARRNAAADPAAATPSLAGKPHRGDGNRL